MGTDRMDFGNCSGSGHDNQGMLLGSPAVDPGNSQHSSTSVWSPESVGWAQQQRLLLGYHAVLLWDLQLFRGEGGDFFGSILKPIEQRSTSTSFESLVGLYDRMLEMITIQSMGNPWEIRGDSPGSYRGTTLMGLDQGSRR